MMKFHPEVDVKMSENLDVYWLVIIIIYFLE